MSKVESPVDPDNPPVEFEEQAVKEYLDEVIELTRGSDDKYSQGEVSAYQCVRANLFGEINECPECGSTEPHFHEVE